MKLVKRKRFMKRKPRKLKLYKNIINQIHRFRQTHIMTSLVSTTSAAVEAGYVFKLQDLSNATAIAELFESYRMTKVIFTIYPRANVATSVVYNSAGPAFVSGAGTACNYYTSIDDTDVSSLGTLAAFLERGNVRVHHSTDVARITIYPQPLATALVSSGTGYQQINKKTWMECKNTATTYYGIRVYLPDISAVAGAVTLDVVATYFFETKGIV